MKAQFFMEMCEVVSEDDVRQLCSRRSADDDAAIWLWSELDDPAFGLFIAGESAVVSDDEGPISGNPPDDFDGTGDVARLRIETGQLEEWPAACVVSVEDAVALFLDRFRHLQSGSEPPQGLRRL